MNVLCPGLMISACMLNQALCGREVTPPVAPWLLSAPQCPLPSLTQPLCWAQASQWPFESAQQPAWPSLSLGTLFGETDRNLLTADWHPSIWMTRSSDSAQTLPLTLESDCDPSQQSSNSFRAIRSVRHPDSQRASGNLMTLLAPFGDRRACVQSPITHQWNHQAARQQFPVHLSHLCPSVSHKPHE